MRIFIILIVLISIFLSCHRSEFDAIDAQNKKEIVAKKYQFSEGSADGANTQVDSNPANYRNPIETKVILEKYNGNWSETDKYCRKLLEQYKDDPIFSRIEQSIAVAMLKYCLPESNVRISKEVRKNIAFYYDILRRNNSPEAWSQVNTFQLIQNDFTSKEREIEYQRITKMVNERKKQLLNRFEKVGIPISQVTKAIEKEEKDYSMHDVVIESLKNDYKDVLKAEALLNDTNI